MKYISTRGNNQELSSAEAIIKGLADDGGLFVPDSMPHVDMAFIEGLQRLSYQERAVKVLSLCFSSSSSLAFARYKTL
ncbi:MAG: hypothetical protein II137_06305 [Anaerovibrio sp.]|nr:hypothetical protein [Anaerovibrio sp.]